MGEALRQEQEYRCNPYSRMIYVVIGQSGAGKTTFCKKNFLIEPYETVSEYPVACTKSGNVYALSVHGSGLAYGDRPEIADSLTYTDDITGSADYKKYLAQTAFTLRRPTDGTVEM